MKKLLITIAQIFTVLTCLPILLFCSCNVVKKSYSKSVELKDSSFINIKDSVSQIINVKTQTSEETTQHADQAVIVLDSTGSTALIQGGNIESVGTIIKVTGPGKISLKRNVQENKKDNAIEYYQSTGQIHDSLTGSTHIEKQVIEKQKQSWRLPFTAVIGVIILLVAAGLLWWLNKKFLTSKKQVDGKV